MHSRMLRPLKENYFVLNKFHLILVMSYYWTPKKWRKLIENILFAIVIISALKVKILEIILIHQPMYQNKFINIHTT